MTSSEVFFQELLGLANSLTEERNKIVPDWEAFPTVNRPLSKSDCEHIAYIDRVLDDLKSHPLVIAKQYQVAR